MDTPISRAEHNEFMHRMEDEHKRIHKRVDEIERTVDKIYTLTGSVEKLALSVERLAQAQSEQAERIREIESRDGEMWRKISSYVITVVIGAVLGYVFTHLGLS